MKLNLLPFTVALLAISGVAFAADKAAPKPAYPLTTCVVSDDKLGGSMGKPAEYLHKEAGKPDRTVMLCCKDCIADFKKAPAKYLAKIDAAAAAAKKK
jgi:hypothetical protein